ncbi:uncharacterized protein [Solanum lycopersicum]|uniref:uncharacterized protein n=1 Tax=Solanum lycopersicum TaxID=4081 RepID=UPI00374996B3
MVSQVVTNQVSQQREAQLEGADTSRIHEFLRMNPQSFTSSSTIRYSEYFVKGLKKILNVMHVIGVERVELDSYQLKNVARTWYNKWKEGREDNALHPNWACFEEALMRRFFSRELKEAKVREFLNLKKESLSVHEYDLKFTHLSRYDLEMVKGMRSRMSLFVVGLGRSSRKEGQGAMLIGDIFILRLMVYVQQVDEEKMKDK